MSICEISKGRHLLETPEKKTHTQNAKKHPQKNNQTKNKKQTNNF